MKTAALRGAYSAERAAALSGVPRSTIHYWARHEILVPSISTSKVRLWSYTDLMGLRTISWLRHGKVGEGGSHIPPSSMPAIRLALSMLKELDLELFTEDERPRVRVDPGGHLYIVPDSGPENLVGMRPLQPSEMFDIIAPFETSITKAPDLHRPRPMLRIVPGKLSGSPHIAHTRIETIAVAALADRGFNSEQIERLYPKAAPVALLESVDLERQLNENLRTAA